MLGIVIVVVTGNSPWVQLYTGSAPDADFTNCHPSYLEFTYIPVACFLMKEWDLYGRDWNADASWHNWLDYEPVVDFEGIAMWKKKVKLYYLKLQIHVL